MYPLTIIDLPGIFSHETENQTWDDKKIVDELVDSYIQQQNSIILVVVAAGEIANQPALRWVNKVDISRKRTLGITTKPDKLDAGYKLEAAIVRLVKNEEPVNKLDLGWHALRNLGPSEAGLKRDDVESNFFSTGAWKEVPKYLVGVHSLRQKLSKILYDHLRSSLPRVIQEIKDQIEENEKTKEKLGDDRSGSKGQRKFLLKVASQFQWLAKDGIDGRYNHQFFGGLDDEDRKLRAQLRNLGRVFDHVIRNKGSKRVLIADDKQTHITVADNFLVDNQPVNDNSWSDGDVLPEYLLKVLDLNPYRVEEPEVLRSSDLRDYLKRQASINQGQEFPGLPKNDLVIQLFREQASPWKDVAQSYIEHVIRVTNLFVEAVFEHIIGKADKNDTTQNILEEFVDRFFAERTEASRKKLDELFYPYSEGVSLPLDTSLRQSFNDRSKAQLVDKLWAILETENPDINEKKQSKGIDKTMISEAVNCSQRTDDDEFGTSKVVEMMLVYYETCLRTFTDNVINLAIESCLIQPVPDIITSTKVGDMDDHELESLVGETPETTAKREQISKDQKILQKGLSTCRSKTQRRITELPARVQSTSAQAFSQTQELGSDPSHGQGDPPPRIGGQVSKGAANGIQNEAQSVGNIDTHLARLSLSNGDEGSGNPEGNGNTSVTDVGRQDG